MNELVEDSEKMYVKEPDKGCGGACAGACGGDGGGACGGSCGGARRGVEGRGVICGVFKNDK